jgi:hypothetical protein
MHVHDVPASVLLEVTANEGRLANRLAAISCNGFSHYLIIRGAPRSGRLLLSRPVSMHYGPPTAFPTVYDATMLVDDLVTLTTTEARYCPAKEPREHARRGWELRSTLLRGVPAVIAWTAWCS